jgi:spore maturation protein CgeB
LNIFVLGSSITSAYWNGAATYYRGIYSSLAALGHRITFAEPDVYDRQSRRDGDDANFAYVKSWVYQTPRDLDNVLAEAAAADLVIKHSGVGADDEFLEREVIELRSPRTKVAFWDVDAPATLARVHANTHDPFRELIPQYDFIFTYGGGDVVCRRYLRLGAHNCRPIYNAIDPKVHFPVDPDPRFECDLAFVGNRLPDRERRVEQFFLRAAELAPEYSFLLGGEGWGSRELPRNVRWIGHVGTGDHNAVNCSARMVLNINRDSMAETGFSPPTRVFEAAGAGACTITDQWDGVSSFFVPDLEILIAADVGDIIRYLREIGPARAAEIGAAMRVRALSDHSYELRAREVDQVLASVEPVRDAEEKTA